MPTLFEKILGIEAAAAIANSMGDVSEGLSYEEIEARYGFLDRLLPQDEPERFRKQDWGTVFHYKAHHRPPGMAEDGQERYRLLTSAILEKGGRITVEDLARTWARDIKPENFGYLLGPQDEVIYRSIMAGIPPSEIGRYAIWPAFIGTSKMIVPIGIVNACNPRQAALDAHDVARLKDVRGRAGNYANEVAAGIAAGIAEGLKPGATVQDVVDVDWRALRPLYADYYKHRRISNAVEVMSGAVALLWLTGPDPKEVILRCVNFGRESDCRAYVAGCWAASIAGIQALPEEWVRTVDEAIANDPWTVSKRSLRESAQGLYDALMNEIRRSKEQIALVEQQCAAPA
jgi:ADP-ribosylglycohydrolase